MARFVNHYQCMNCKQKFEIESDETYAVPCMNCKKTCRVLAAHDLDNEGKFVACPPYVNHGTILDLRYKNHEFENAVVSREDGVPYIRGTDGDFSFAIKAHHDDVLVRLSPAEPLPASVTVSIPVGRFSVALIRTGDQLELSSAFASQLDSLKLSSADIKRLCDLLAPLRNDDRVKKLRRVLNDIVEHLAPAQFAQWLRAAIVNVLKETK